MSANEPGVSFLSNKDALVVGSGNVAKLCRYTKTAELRSVKR